MCKRNKSEQFFDIICSYNTYFSSAMDNDISKLSDYSLENVLETIKKMESLLNDIKKQTKKDDEDNHLESSLKTTKYFLEHKILWNTPFYYYFRIKSNLEICWNGYSIINGEPVKKDVIKKRLFDFSRYIDVAIDNMKNVELGKIDCIYGISKFKSMNSNLFLYIQNILKIDVNFEIINCQLKKMYTFLERKKEESNRMFIPIGTDILKRYITLETGLIFTVDSLRSILYESLKIEKGFQKKGVKIDTNNINSILVEIINAGKEKFGLQADVENTISYKYVCKEENENLNYIGYVSNSMKNEECKGTFIYNDRYKKREKFDKVLGIVHEIYPGHHYINCINRKNNKGKISKILYESMAFTEGWAKYCEYIYASQILKEKEYFKYFTNQMERISLISIIAFEIHFNNKQYTEVYDYINNFKNGIYISSANSIILQAYSLPIESISIVLGFMFFYYKFGLNINIDILKEIYDEGAWIMKGRKI